MEIPGQFSTEIDTMISDSGAIDPTREGLATAVRMLEERFKRDFFYARDVASAMRQATSDNDDDADATSALLKPAWTQDEVEQFQDGLRTAMDDKEEPSRGRRSGTSISAIGSLASDRDLGE